MTQLYKNIAGLALLLTVMLGVGCDRSSAPPVALAVTEFPAAFAKEFSKAKPETKELTSQIVAAVQAKDYSRAFQGLQTLNSQSVLTKAQMNVVAGALLTVNELLQAAQAEGNPQAVETINNYQSTK